MSVRIRWSIGLRKEFEKKVENFDVRYRRDNVGQRS